MDQKSVNAFSESTSNGAVQQSLPVTEDNQSPDHRPDTKAMNPTPNLVLQGVVRYVLASPNNINAKWLSTRLVERFSSGGIGKAARLDPTTLKEVTNENAGEYESTGFTGTWKIVYYEPDGQIAVTPFVLRLQKKGDIWFGSWALPQTPDKVVLTGFGFEDGNEGVVMRYGS